MVINRQMDVETARQWDEWCDRKIQVALVTHEDLLIEATTEYVVEETNKLRQMISELQTDVAVLRRTSDGTATRSFRNLLAMLLLRRRAA